MYYDTSNSSSLHFNQFGRLTLVLCKYSILKNKKKNDLMLIFFFPLNFVISKICENFQKVRKKIQIHNRKQGISQHFCWENWNKSIIYNVCMIPTRITKYLLCHNPTLTKCGGEAQHLEKVKIWSPPGLPNV